MPPKWMIPAGAVVLLAAAATVWRHRAPRVVPQTSSRRPASEVLLGGTVEPRSVMDVQPSVEGILDAWAVEIGQPVYKDQLLGRVRVAQVEDAARQAQDDLDRLQSRVDSLDGARTAAKLEISRAEAEKSRADAETGRLKKIYDRYQGLWDLGAIARLDFEKSETDYKSAQNQAQNAQNALDTAHQRDDAIAAEGESLNREIAEKTQALAKAKTDIASGDLHSLADGVVIARRGDPGQPVDPSMHGMIRIATDLTKLQVIVTPAAMDLPRIHPGQAATVRLDGGEFQGSVREIRGEQVAVDFDTSAPVAKPGGAAQVRIKF